MFADLLLAQSSTPVVADASSQWAVGWGTLSLINAGLAQSKGHSGLGWWLGSLLLGPVATFVIVALLDRRPVALPAAEAGPKPPGRDEEV